MGVLTRGSAFNLLIDASQTFFCVQASSHTVHFSLTKPHLGFIIEPSQVVGANFVVENTMDSAKSIVHW